MCPGAISGVSITTIVDVRSVGGRGTTMYLGSSCSSSCMRPSPASSPVGIGIVGTSRSAVARMSSCPSSSLSASASAGISSGGSSELGPFPNGMCFFLGGVALVDRSSDVQDFLCDFRPGDNPSKHLLPSKAPKQPTNQLSYMPSRVPGPALVITYHFFTILLVKGMYKVVMVEGERGKRRLSRVCV